MLAVWRSPTVDSWPLEMCVGFFKPMQSSSPFRAGWDREENHLGAYVVPYPNVCLAVTGQWHHPITDAPPEHPDYLAAQVSADLGFAYSEDGVHFKEPAPGFTFVPRDQEMGWDRDFRGNTTNDHLIMIQGPMVNAGEETFIYYTAFTAHRRPHGGAQQPGRRAHAAGAFRQPGHRGGRRVWTGGDGRDRRGGLRPGSRPTPRSSRAGHLQGGPAGR